MRLLLVEDDKDLGDRLRAILTRAGFAVDLAPDGESGLRMGMSEPYELVVLDLGLPKLPGLEVLRRWRASGQSIPVLALTSRSAWTERVEGLNAGADDYLCKPFQPDELVARLRALMRRSVGRTDTVLRAGNVVINPATGSVLNGEQTVDLTAREMRILTYLLHRRGQIVSQQQIAEAIYAGDEMCDSNTIEVYIGRLRKKLGRDLIRTMRGLGYRIAS